MPPPASADSGPRPIVASKSSLLPVVLIVIGALIRVLLASSSTLQTTLASRVEIATPLTAPKRLWECVYAWENLGSPYSSSLCHEPPLLIAIFSLLRDHPVLLVAIFTLIDMLTAISLMIVVRHAIRLMKRTFADEMRMTRERGVLNENDAGQRAFEHSIGKVDEGVAVLALVGYLFHPYAIMSCVAQSTAVLENAALAVTLAAMLTDHISLACATLSLAAYRSPYSIQFIVPIVLHARASTRNTPLCIVVQFVACCTALMVTSYAMLGDWSFVDAVYHFILSAPDLTPNVGLHWYFFTEMFEHFRTLYECVFQLNTLVYVVPLAICLSHDPISMYVLQLMLVAIFKPYPSIADAALYMPLLVMYKHLTPLLRYELFAGATLLVCTLFAPIMWSLWIVQGSGNANFYFATTLAYGAAQVFIVTDLLYALLRHRVHLQNGAMTKDAKGKEIDAVLF